MSLRRLFIWPWLLTLIFIGGHALCIPHGKVRDLAFDWMSLGIKALAFGGLCMGALAFQRGDYLRKAFAFEAGTFGLLIIRDLTGLLVFVKGALVGLSLYLPMRYTLVVLANLCAVSSGWMLAWVSDEAGLLGLGGRRRRALLILAGLTLGLLLSGPAVLKSLPAVFEGKSGAVVTLISSAGDTITIALSAPILLTALALRGGFLYYAWGLVAASRILWLLYDGMAIFPNDIALLPLVRSGEEALRMLAGLYECMAGIAFWKILKGNEELDTAASNDKSL